MIKYVRISVFLFAFSTTYSQAAEYQLLTKDIVSNLTLYAMMASNAYAGDEEKVYFPLEKLGWMKVNKNGSPVPKSESSYRPSTIFGSLFSNLQFDIWEDINSNKTVIAFKGTKEKIDWINGNLMIGISIPYKSAKKHVSEYKISNPKRSVTVTGHSLGGGLALSVSVWEGVDAVVFNTSPRIFDGRDNMNKPANRVAVFQENDILQKIRKWYPKFLEKIKPEQIIETSFNYSGRDAHRSDLLAEGLLSCSSEPQMQELAKSVNLSVSCYVD